MKTLNTLLLGFVLLILCTGVSSCFRTDVLDALGNGNKPKTLSSQYNPLQVGNTWNYVSDFNEIHSEYTVQVVSSKTFQGIEYAMIVTSGYRNIQGSTEYFADTTFQRNSGNKVLQYSELGEGEVIDFSANTVKDSAFQFFLPASTLSGKFVDNSVQLIGAIRHTSYAKGVGFIHSFASGEAPFTHITRMQQATINGVVYSPLW